jgi:catechol 2,3-dioxygenase-like lactoylglutathione lyase family enzyme
VKYVHTNLIAHDWRSLSAFYEKVFGCTPVGPDRDLTGVAMERATGVQTAHLRGRHLLLPGYGADGPTLEIFSYAGTNSHRHTAPSADRPGFGHIAFAVDDPEATLREVLRAGGSQVGETVSVTVSGAGVCTFAYVRDPEGNIIELQKWSRR